MNPTVVAIVPAYNEGERIGRTIGALLRTGRVVRVLVVDDGSADDTAERALRAGAEVLRLPRNRGKSVALAAGVSASPEEVFLFVDADLGDSAERVTDLLDPVLAGQADMAIAAWPAAGREGGFGIVRRFSAWLVRLFTGKHIANPLSGQRALIRPVWQCWRGSVGYGFEVALTIDALRAGWRVAEVPLPLSHRALGRSLPGFLHRARQLCHILYTVVARCLPW